MRFLAVAAMPLLLAAFPATARDVAVSEIARGEYAAAEAKLDAELRIHPKRPELLLNLAAVYARTGRQAQARSLYRQVLAGSDVLMDVSADRTAGAHAVAANGLRSLAAQSAAR